MKRNTAGQFIGAQMVAAADGSAFTGAVTVYVTGDAGTQAVGSVGSGACTHEGNGFHTYAPAQAETNYSHIGFTFVGTGAIPATVQVFPSFPQTGDNFARLGAPAGASLAADVAALQADTDNIQTRLPAALVSGRIDASVGAVATNAIDSAALAASAGAEIATAVRTELATELARIDAATSTRATQTSVDAIAGDVTTIGGLSVAIKAKTDNLPSDPADASVIAAALAPIGTTVAKLDDTLEDSGGGAWIFTTDALANAPAGGTGLDAAGIRAAIGMSAPDLDDQLAALPAAAADAVLDEAVADHLTAGSVGRAIADTDERGMLTTCRGTVSGTAPTATTLTPSALTPAGVDADQFKGRIIVFDRDTTTAALRGQISDITASSAAALPLLTFTALSRAPVAGDTFTIV